jgi:hypothetical protein
MNFRGHLVGGVLTATAAAAAATRWGYIDPLDYATWGGVWATAVFFSLFPDFDTASVPQRWFFRCVFLALVYLAVTGQFELATLVGLLSILPLLDHHRGWTHWKLSPVLVPVFLGAVYEYWRAQHAWIDGFSWENIGGVLRGHAVFLAASIAGWYTHLLLDGQFKIFPTDRDHH